MNNIEIDFTLLNKVKTMNILFAEDDDNVRESVGFILKELCGEFYSAADADEALRIFDENHIDIIITDINMPGISGVEFINKIKEKDLDIPVIFLTAYTDTEYVTQSSEIKNSQYFTKPLDMQMLQIALQRAITMIEEN